MNEKEVALWFGYEDPKAMGRALEIFILSKAFLLVDVADARRGKSDLRIYILRSLDLKTSSGIFGPIGAVFGQRSSFFS